MLLTGVRICSLLCVHTIYFIHTHTNTHFLSCNLTHSQAHALQVFCVRAQCLRPSYPRLHAARVGMMCVSEHPIPPEPSFVLRVCACVYVYICDVCSANKCCVRNRAQPFLPAPRYVLVLCVCVCICMGVCVYVCVCVVPTSVMGVARALPCAQPPPSCAQLAGIMCLCMYVSVCVYTSTYLCMCVYV
jgi:hypothetical protein